MISTQAYVVGGTYSMTSMTASALRPWRSKCRRWRSPLPLLVGPGTAETQLGSHSGMRLASEMRSKTSWIVTPTVPVYVSETGRMGDNMAAERQRAAEKQGAAERHKAAKAAKWRVPARALAAHCRLCRLSALSASGA